MAGAQYYRQGFVGIPQHGQTGGEGFGESPTDTQRAALPGKRQRGFEPILFALNTSFRLGGGLPIP